MKSKMQSKKAGKTLLKAKTIKKVSSPRGIPQNHNETLVREF